MTERMPLASIRKVTSTRGTPAGSGQIGILKRARLRLSLASSRSPCRTWMSTAVWLSTAVVKVSLTLVGMVVLRSTSRVKTPPMVSMPSESGTTSRRSMSRRRPERMPAWIPAPSATTRSGSMSVSGGRPKMASIWRRTKGTRVEPPTATTHRMSAGRSPASLSAWRHGPAVRSTRSFTSASNSARVTARRAGPSTISARSASLSVRLTCSAAARARARTSARLRSASGSSASTSSARRSSKSSPPRCVSPLVASTSNTPARRRRTEMSKVPPPRS